jgi:serine/threonine-protein kinase
MLNPRLAIASLILTLALAGLFCSIYAQGEKNSLLPVRLGGKWGYINKSGTVVVAPQFDYAMPFSSGLALVVTNAKIPNIGYLRESGQIAIKPQFWRVNAFSEGLAVVESCGQYGFINTKGHVVIFPQFIEVLRFSEGLAAVRISERTEGGQTGEPKWGLLIRMAM